MHRLGEPVPIRMMFGRRDPVYMIVRRAGPRSANILCGFAVPGVCATASKRQATPGKLGLGSG